MILTIVILMGVIIYDSVTIRQVNKKLAVIESSTNIERELRIGAQNDLLKFYKNDYCDGKTRPILFKGFHTQFNALYCDKPAVLLLMNDLPISIIHNTGTTNE